VDLPQAQQAANHGFLPTRASAVLDFLFLAMFAILAILAFSIYLAKYQGKYAWHKRLQLILGVVLLTVVIAFEINIRFASTDWRGFAQESPFFASGIVGYALWLRLCFAVPTPLLWIYVIARALREFPRPPAPGEHSRRHIFWARLAAIGLFLTTLTGWLFYWLAFVA
jgi:hypothetical protein